MPDLPAIQQIIATTQLSKESIRHLLLSCDGIEDEMLENALERSGDCSWLSRNDDVQEKCW